jgi:hypothetical protein
MARREKKDIEKAADIIRDAGGKVVGRTRLQKIAYLLELTGLGEGFEFEYKHYGPYSEQLANAVAIATVTRLISEEERSTTWGGTYSVFTVDSATTGNVPDARLQLISRATSIDPITLELAATAAFFAAEGEPDPWGETARRKSEKADIRLESAKEFYRELASLPTPVPIPINRVILRSKAQASGQGLGIGES